MANQKPHTIRIGRIRASVFAHNGENGSRWFSTSFSRSYLDEKGKTQYTDRFNHEDLPVIEKLSDKATDYIIAEQQRED